MASRMDRYYESHPEDMKRTNKNSKLYDDLYGSSYYENIESASLNVGKEIDIHEVKDLLNKREAYKELRDYRIVKPEAPVTRKVKYYEETEQNSHDLNEMLDKAKVERPTDDKKRSLAETQVINLQELVSKKAYAKKTKIDKEEVKDLLTTLYDTNLLSSDDGTGLLDELKSTGHTIASPSIKQVLEDAKKNREDDDVSDMDNSFFTSSLGFKNEDLKGEEETEEGSDKTLRFLMILGIIFIIIVLFIIIKFVIF